MTERMAVICISLFLICFVLGADGFLAARSVKLKFTGTLRATADGTQINAQTCTPIYKSYVDTLFNGNITGLLVNSIKGGLLKIKDDGHDYQCATKGVSVKYDGVDIKITEPQNGKGSVELTLTFSLDGDPLAVTDEQMTTLYTCATTVGLIATAQNSFIDFSAFLTIKTEHIMQICPTVAVAKDTIRMRLMWDCPPENKHCGNSINGLQVQLSGPITSPQNIANSSQMCAQFYKDYFTSLFQSNITTVLTNSIKGGIVRFGAKKCESSIAALLGDVKVDITSNTDNTKGTVTVNLLITHDNGVLLTVKQQAEVFECASILKMLATTSTLIDFSVFLSVRCDDQCSGCPEVSVPKKDIKVLLIWKCSDDGSDCVQQSSIDNYLSPPTTKPTAEDNAGHRNTWTSLLYTVTMATLLTN